MFDAGGVEWIIFAALSAIVPLALEFSAARWTVKSGIRSTSGELHDALSQTSDAREVIERDQYWRIGRDIENGWRTQAIKRRDSVIKTPFMCKRARDSGKSEKAGR